jgi:hypothetical protein
VLDDFARPPNNIVSVMASEGKPLYYFIAFQCLRAYKLKECFALCMLGAAAQELYLISHLVGK